MVFCRTTPAFGSIGVALSGFGICANWTGRFNTASVVAPNADPDNAFLKIHSLCVRRHFIA
jgi:hypothetical protein